MHPSCSLWQHDQNNNNIKNTTWITSRTSKDVYHWNLDKCHVSSLMQTKSYLFGSLEHSISSRHYLDQLPLADQSDKHYTLPYQYHPSCLQASITKREGTTVDKWQGVVPKSIMLHNLTNEKKLLAFNKFLTCH